MMRWGILKVQAIDIVRAMTNRGGVNPHTRAVVQWLIPYCDQIVIVLLSMPCWATCDKQLSFIEGYWFLIKTTTTEHNELNAPARGGLHLILAVAKVHIHSIPNLRFSHICEQAMRQVSVKRHLQKLYILPIFYQNQMSIGHIWYTCVLVSSSLKEENTVIVGRGKEFERGLVQWQLN